MRAAGSGASRPLSIAATAGVRMGAMRISGENPPEQRPSVRAATSHRRSARPSSTAMMARARTPWVVVMSGRSGDRLGL